ncbi:MAG: T9SS type A sorting domain-containing protein [Chitinophagales bacterium]|nr:T9SS type A sorting domain-containing protein [Chitinophagales bacterium]
MQQSHLWVVKLSSEGELEWQKMLGGSSLDWAFYIAITSDGGYAVLGQIGWNDWDISEYFGGFDIWLVKLSELGDIQWEQTFGGSNNDYVGSIEVVADGFVIAGATQSMDGHAIGNDGGQDLWVLKLDNTGNIIWQNSLGGAQGEWANSIIQTVEGDLVMAGYTRSNNGDVSGNHGSTDFWIVKLAPETSSTQTPAAIPLNLYPNPANQWITLNLPIIEQQMQVSITDEQGRLLQTRMIRTDEKLDIAAHPPGIYWVSAVSKSGKVYAGKFVKG